MYTLYIEPMVSHFGDQNTSPEPIEKVKAKLKDQLKGVPRREGDTTWNPRVVITFLDGCWMDVGWLVGFTWNHMEPEG